MRHLVEATRKAVSNENWYAALGLALTLPDICGRLQAPSAGSRSRYVDWCNVYLTPRYTRLVGAQQTRHVFLHGEDCYALRCAVLHEGSDDIVNQRAATALDSFMFVAPRLGLVVHCNQVNSHLQLQVDIFAEDVCVGVETWIAATATDAHVTEAMRLLMEIRSMENGLRI